MMASVEEILATFDREHARFESYRAATTSLLENLLKASDLRVHSVSSRVKDRESLRKKVLQKNYTSLPDVTDLVGIRIITHYDDEVDAICALIEKEFSIDKAKSVDKRAAIAPDRFGYLSVHYVCSLNEARTALAEYRGLQRMVAEIQVRSILQHAWAEIEHDLGYKSETGIPALARRRFSRLAGLLEVGDAEFMALRDAIDGYREEIKAKIVEAPPEVAVDDVTIAELIASDLDVIAMDKKLAAIRQVQLSDRVLEGQAEELRRAGLRSIGEVKTALMANAALIEAVYRKRAKLQRRVPNVVVRGMSLLYLRLTVAIAAGRGGWTTPHNDEGSRDGLDEFAQITIETARELGLSRPATDGFTRASRSKP